MFPLTSRCRSRFGWTSALLALLLAAAGCATPTLPRGARLVGGGLLVDYQAPVDGTAILVERSSGRMVASESLDEGNNFRFGPNQSGFEEVMLRMFAPTNSVDGSFLPTLPANTHFDLYFVPEKHRQE